jgi:hypothetical protein
MYYGRQICFFSVCIGPKYVETVKKLAETLDDLRSPPLYLLTDRPKTVFEAHHNIIPVRVTEDKWQWKGNFMNRGYSQSMFVRTEAPRLLEDVLSSSVITRLAYMDADFVPHKQFFQHLPWSGISTMAAGHPINTIMQVPSDYADISNLYRFSPRTCFVITDNPFYCNSANNLWTSWFELSQLEPHRNDEYTLAKTLVFLRPSLTYLYCADPRNRMVGFGYHYGTIAEPGITLPAVGCCGGN